MAGEETDDRKSSNATQMASRSKNDNSNTMIPGVASSAYCSVVSDKPDMNEIRETFANDTPPHQETAVLPTPEQVRSADPSRHRRKGDRYSKEGRPKHNLCNSCGFLQLAHERGVCPITAEKHKAPCKIKQELDNGTLLGVECKIEGIDVKHRSISFRAFLSFDVSRSSNKPIDRLAVNFDAFVVCKRRSSLPKRTKRDGTTVVVYACKHCGCPKMREIHDVLHAFILREKRSILSAQSRDSSKVIPV